MSGPAALDKPTPPDSARLTDADISKMLELLKGSTTVELKLMVDDAPGATLRRLGFDPVEAQPRQVYFFDTPDLSLNRAGAHRSGPQERWRQGRHSDQASPCRPVVDRC